MVDYIKIGTEKGYIKIDEKADKIYYLNTAPKDKIKRPFKIEDGWSDPEEKVRASIFVKLIEDFNFKPDHMAIEVQPDTARNKYPADILVLDRDWNPYIVVETKAKERDLETAKAQGDVNANLFNIRPQFIYVAGNKTDNFDNLDLVEKFYQKNGDILIEIPSIPGIKNKIEYFYYNIETPTNSSQKILERVEDKSSLIRKFNQAHDIIWNGGQFDPSQAIDEFSKILFTKLKDELDTPNDEPYVFQIKYTDGSPDFDETYDKVNKFYETHIMDKFNEPIRVGKDKVIEIIKIFQNVSLVKTPTDALGEAFETILSDTFRGKEGQYFTPREVIDFMSKMVAPLSDKTLIDPACGSGGFLEYAVRFVRDKELKGRYNNIDVRVENYVENIAGIELSTRLSRISMSTLSLYGKYKNPRIINTTAFNSLKTYKPFIENKIEEHKFDLIMTNPPFSGLVDSNNKDQLGESSLGDFQVSRDKSRAEIIDLFMERYWHLLKTGGKLAVVISDGFLFSQTHYKGRKFFFEHFQIDALISLPTQTFKPYGAGVKTSIIFATALDENQSPDKNKKFFIASAEHVGYNETRKFDINDLPRILENYRDGTEPGKEPNPENDNENERFGKLIDYDKIDVNDMMVLKYIENSNNEENVDIDKLSKEIDEAQNELNTTWNKIKNEVKI